MNTDRIRKEVVLHAPRKRVWSAITDAGEFGTWFGVEIDGPFVAGQDAIGTIMPTKVDPEVARLQEPHRGTAFRIRVEKIEPMQLFSFRWHPFAIDSTQNYEVEPMTLVTFELADVEDGVQLTIEESGFDELPVGRRETAWTANDGGWEHQVKLIERYLSLYGIQDAP